MERLVRHSEPNQYDHAEMGTECLVTLESGWKLFKQMSIDEANPRWECIDDSYLPDMDDNPKKDS